MASLANLVASGATREPSRPIVRLGPHTFAHGRRAVIFRYITADELDELRALGPERVYYLIDDMLPLAHACLELPAAYRRRLAHFALNLLPSILDLNPTVVAPSGQSSACFPIARANISTRLSWPLPAIISILQPPGLFAWRFSARAATPTGWIF
jgi:hypothetical protein